MGRSGARYDAAYTVTAVKTGTYTAAPGELVRCDATSGSFTVTLPAANSAGQQVAVQLLATSGTNAVTVARAGSDTINNGVTSVTLALADEALVFTSNGSGVWTIAGGQKSLASLDARFTGISDNRLVALYSDRLTTGEFIPDRRLCNYAVGAVSQTLMLNYFTAATTETITTITAYTASTAAAATPTLCRYGVYSVAGNGDLTLIASTPNDTSLWAATQTGYPKALSSSWSKVAGTRYAVGLLQVSSTTVATFVGCQTIANNAGNTISRLSPPIIGRVLSQTDLPSSVANASVIGFQGIPAFLLS